MRALRRGRDIYFDDAATFLFTATTKPLSTSTQAYLYDARAAILTWFVHDDHCHQKSFSEDDGGATPRPFARSILLSIYFFHFLRSSPPVRLMIRYARLSGCCLKFS